MGVAKDIERRLEGLLEGFFTRVFRSGLQPVEVGRRIVREMEEGRTISVNRTYAPNEFRIYMGSDDHGRFAQMQAGLEREFTDVIIEQAKQNRWNLMGLPRLSFHEDPSMGRGEFRVDASLAADPDVGAPRVSTRSPDETGESATRAIAIGRAGSSDTGVVLEVLDASGKATERIAINRTPVSIGRLSSNDVVLSDPNVSRRHAELRSDGRRWTVVDLGSTNGTLVNGKLAKEQALTDGDRLAFGTSEMVFRAKDRP